MLQLKLESATDPLKVLCLGAHSDDIEIGCGGTLLQLMKNRRKVEVCWVVLSAAGARKQEALQSADLFLAGAENKQIFISDFRDGFFPYTGGQIKEYFEDLKNKYYPDLIFTHFRNDLHQDHRLVSDLTWNTYRAHYILEYEILKYDGDLGLPNTFVHLDREIFDLKNRYIGACFKTQASRTWFGDETALALPRLRGVESNAPGGYAEAFYARKTRLQI